MGEIFRLEGVSKSFKSGSESLQILNNINLSLPEGVTLAIQGKSGSGKSTLLSIMALIEKPTSGKVIYGGKDTTCMNEAEIAALHRKTMAFVFQNSLLLEDFTALENVALPLMNNHISKKESYDMAREILARVGLEDRISHRSTELSGGERQRVALARALVTKPAVLFADEPTGALDEESAKLVEDLILNTVTENKLSLVLVTHNSAFAARCEKVLTLSFKELHE
ncbi:MAG: ABC transporter ATP-binding protein [Spirochaetales bacterium]|nr:ABC transporter ATP-binding protein [Spirochaetales bacterium]